MSFTDQKERIATEEECTKGLFGGGRKGSRFGCYLCGKKFIAGDYWRWVHCTDRKIINLSVCRQCDGPDVIDRWLKHYEDFMQRFWCFTEYGAPNPTPPAEGKSDTCSKATPPPVELPTTEAGDVCPTCDGRGIRVLPKNKAENYTQNPCPTCHGTGHQPAPTDDKEVTP